MLTEHGVHVLRHPQQVHVVVDRVAAGAGERLGELAAAGQEPPKCPRLALGPAAEIGPGAEERDDAAREDPAGDEPVVIVVGLLDAHTRSASREPYRTEVTGASLDFLDQPNCGRLQAWSCTTDH
ncbi:MAG TPA: hypothetical protein VI006_14515 [Solirubrobacteraceae bacterium]